MLEGVNKGKGKHLSGTKWLPFREQMEESLGQLYHLTYIRARMQLGTVGWRVWDTGMKVQEGGFQEW